MRCCALGCKNDSRHMSKSQGITFHVFPVEPSYRSSWMHALGKKQWKLKERRAVCSDHFLPEDLYETKSGLRRVRPGAVPIVLQDVSVCEFGQPARVMVCRICLVTDSKLFAINKYKLEQAYQHLTGLTLNQDDKLPQMLCPECAQRLLNYNKFKNKSLRANSILNELVKKQDNLSLKSIKSIDRHSNYLSSTLAPKVYRPDHFDLHIQDPRGDVVVVKDESNEVFINEEEDFADDQMKDDKFEEEKVSEDVPEETIAEETEQMDNDNDLDHNYAATYKDSADSSDDSEPLETKRMKKKVKPKPKFQEDTVKKVRKRQASKEPAEPKIDRRRKPFLNDDLNETLFTITDLTFEEQVAEILKRQESANYKNAIYKCTECFKGFLDEDAYNGHMSRHTKDCGDYKCDICKTHFKHPHALRKHITAHHTQRFSCNQCLYVTTHRQTARLHERWHKGTKYQCPHCPEEFVKFTTYMGHVRIKHPSDFVCQLCGFSFVSEKGIELHKKLKHRLHNDEIPEDGPLCELCNLRFVSSEALRQHIRVSARHNTTDKDQRESNKPKKGRKSKEAKERERRAKDKNMRELEDKRRVYPSQMRKAEGPIPCEQCGMQLEDSRAYHGHFRRAHPDKNRTNYPSMKSPCMCEVCGRMFQSYALLKDHTWTHTGERPFKCDACGKCFRMKQRLVAHRRVHSQMKASYACELCGKHFSTQSNRQRHMFIHTGLKPFKCEMCGKCFKHASEKRAHITYVHLKKPWPKRSRGKRRSDSRQGTLPPPSAIPTSASEMDIVPPLWPTCDPKLDHMNDMMHRKTEKDWRHLRCGAEGWNE
ncbi:zinc finger protein 354A-like isoform X2 [Pectinophora gossypiella]|uniref:zinc finger protein 354A-like isoform X2 n=1 Tax=Pectinophora gossypiella TaxID=13191 RepID=UPI00214E2D79|nr:zinc finger protein 354A-like isoform X2 [Pectinophora gossypiella]